MKTLIKKASWLKPMRVAAMIIVTGLSLVAYEDLRALMSTGPAVMTGNASAVTNQYTGTSGAYDRSYQGYGVPDFNMEDAVSPLPLPKPPALPLPEPPPLPPAGENPGAEPSGPVMPGDSPPAISPEPGPTQPPKEAPKPENPEGVDAGKKGTANGERAGKRFTKKGKKEVIKENEQVNEGKTVCVNCKDDTVPAQQGKKGVSPPRNETNVDHIVPKSKQGDGAPANGQILCRTCNIQKSNK